MFTVHSTAIFVHETKFTTPQFVVRKIRIPWFTSVLVAEIPTLSLSLPVFCWLNIINHIEYIETNISAETNQVARGCTARPAQAVDPPPASVVWGKATCLDIGGGIWKNGWYENSELIYKQGGTPKIAKLVNITPITMVYRWYIELGNGLITNL